MEAGSGANVTVGLDDDDDDEDTAAAAADDDEEEDEAGPKAAAAALKSTPLSCFCEEREKRCEER